jgi:hypothetical protein
MNVCQSGFTKMDNWCYLGHMIDIVSISAHSSEPLALPSIFDRRRRYEVPMVGRWMLHLGEFEFRSWPFWNRAVPIDTGADGGHRNHRELMKDAENGQLEIREVNEEE